MGARRRSQVGIDVEASGRIGRLDWKDGAHGERLFRKPRVLQRLGRRKTPLWIILEQLVKQVEAAHSATAIHIPWIEPLDHDVITSYCVP